MAFNKNVTAEDGITFTFAGNAVAAENVAYAGNKATLTVPTMVDDNTTTYAVVVTDNEGTELYNDSIMWDRNQPTTLTIETVDMSQTVGEDFILTVKLVDEDGDVMANKALTMDVTPSFGVNNEELTLNATTDENGLATFKWTRTRPDAGETIDVFVNERPVVRVSGTVVWGTALKLVDVDAKTAVTLGFGTAKEYVITAKNADGTDYTGTLAIKYEGTNAIDTNITAEYKNANGVWTALTDTSAGDAYVDGIALTTANTGNDGQITIRLYAAANATEISPIFFQDVDTDIVLDSDEARITGGTINYVDQVPTFTWEPLNDTTTIATSALAGSTTHQKDYTLKVNDQFGNPYRGTVLLTTIARADGLAGTVPSNNEGIAVDLNMDGDFTDAGEGAATTKTINMAIGGAVTAEDSIVTVRITDTAAEAITPVAMVDVANPVGQPADVAGLIDDNDYYATADTLDFQNRAVETIIAEAVTEGDIAVGGNGIYKFTFRDQFGEPITPAAVDFAIEGANAGTIEIDAIDLSYDGQTFNADATINATSANNQNAASDVVAVRIDSGAADDQAVIRVWIDAGTNDNTFQADEKNATIETGKFVAPALANGEITTVAFATADVYNAIATAEGVDAAGQSANGNANEATLTYTLQDQAGNVYTTGASETVDVTWTVTNNGDTTAQVDDGTGYVDVAAGETKIFTTTVAASSSTTTLKVDAKAAAESHKLTISAQAAGVSEASEVVVAFTAAPTITQDPAVAAEYSGTIIGVQADGDDNGTVANNDGTLLIIETTLGQVLAVQIGSGDYGTVTLKIDGNTVTTETLAEGNISVGDAISISIDGNGDGNTPAAPAAYDAGDKITITSS